MKIIKNGFYSPLFSSSETFVQGGETKTAPQNKETFLDKFETKIRNSADLNDTIQVPRTIFKGYLGIMTSTVLATLAMFSKKTKLKTGLNITSAVLAVYGTFSFVRPYIIKTPKELSGDNQSSKSL